MDNTEPRASRPYMPGYGILDANAGRGLLPWSWASERLAKARNFWIATTRPDGRPHVMPVWGVWLDDTFYFSTGPQSRKAQNLATNPQCTVGAEPADEPVIVEGVAQRVADPLLLKRVADVYSQKYQWKIKPTEDGVRDEHGNSGPVFAVHPRVVFGFEDLIGSATRWTFDAA